MRGFRLLFIFGVRTKVMMLRRETVIAQADDWTPPPLIPYVWGGTSRQGADCSGFIVGVFRELKEPFPQGIRTAEQIRQACTLKPRNEAKPGDLIFFEKTYSNPDDIDKWGPDGRIATHIGFVVEEGSPTKMLDTHAGVFYSDLNSYWEQHFLGIGTPPQIAEDAPEDTDMEEARSFISNALATDGEIQTALRGIQKNFEEQKTQDAQQNVDALLSRVAQLWSEWTG